MAFITKKINEQDILKIVHSIVKKPSPLTDSYLDDSAILTIGTEKLLISTDSLVTGTHIPPNAEPEDYAYRLVGRVLSDIAAMGGIPLYCTLNVNFNHETQISWLKTFFRTLDKRLHEYGTQLVGGDTVKIDGPMSFTMTILGRAENSSLRRNQAFEGERIYVTGYIGDAYLGFQIFSKNIICASKKDREYFFHAYFQPKPLISLGHKLTSITSSGVDISDGLLLDAARFAEASKLTAFIRLDDIPFSPPAKKILSQLKPAVRRKIQTEMMSWGDDYQLMFSAPPSKEYDISSLSHDFQMPITNIGHFASYEDNMPSSLSYKHLELFDKKGDKLQLEKLGYTHGL